MKMKTAVPFMRFIGYSHGLARVYGIPAAILTGYIINRLPEDDEDAEVKATVEQISEGTALSWKQINLARKKSKGLIRFRYKRLTHESFWGVNFDALRTLLARPVGAVANLPKGDNPVAQREIGNRRGDLKGETKGGPNLPSGGEKGVIQAFAEVYRTRFKRPYVPDPKKDVTAARSLLAAGLSAEEVAGVFNHATRTKGFWCSKVASLPDLAARWNDVQAEIQRATGAHAEPDGGQTPAEWAKEITSLETPAEGKATK